MIILSLRPYATTKELQYAAVEESPMQPILTSNWACFQWVVVSVAPSILDVVVNFLPQ